MIGKNKYSSSNEFLWGIDLGGTKIEGVILRSLSHEVVVRRRIKTESERGYAHVLQQIDSLVQILKNESNLTPYIIGFGTPGTLDPDTQTLRGSNSQHLNGKPLKVDLENTLGIPVLIENDANCLALAESRLGIVPSRVPDATSVFGIIMGTGVGGGLVINNQLVSGRNKITGEWGHNFLDESGGQCFCGRIGCVETIISGPALERYYHSISGEHLSLEQIARKAEQDDKFAQATIDRLLKFFGLAVAQLINTLDPDAIVVGGGVGNIDQLYTRGFDEIAKHVFTPRLSTQLLKPKLGDSAGVFGAAQLCSDKSHD